MLPSSLSGSGTLEAVLQDTVVLAMDTTDGAGTYVLTLCD